MLIDILKEIAFLLFIAVVFALTLFGTTYLLHCDGRPENKLALWFNRFIIVLFSLLLTCVVYSNTVRWVL